MKYAIKEKDKERLFFPKVYVVESFGALSL